MYYVRRMIALKKQATCKQPPKRHGAAGNWTLKNEKSSKGSYVLITQKICEVKAGSSIGLFQLKDIPPISQEAYWASTAIFSVNCPKWKTIVTLFRYFTRNV